MTNLLELIKEFEDKQDNEVINVYLENVDVEDFVQDVKNLVKEDEQTIIDKKIDQITSQEL